MVFSGSWILSGWKIEINTKIPDQDSRSITFTFGFKDWDSDTAHVCTELAKYRYSSSALVLKVIFPKQVLYYY